MKKMFSFLMMGFVFFVFSIVAISQPEMQWWKGNLHTHSLWSDGDEYPEMIVNWYKTHDYDFLALSDHNILSQGEKWIQPENSRGGMEAFEKYLERFGEEWVETAQIDKDNADKVKPLIPRKSLFGDQAPTIDYEKLKGEFIVRLKPLNEFQALFEENGKFMLMQSEEITDHYHHEGLDRNLPVHLNATNIVELVPPQGGDSVQEVLQNNIDAVLEQRDRIGQPMFPHINHPNFGWAVTAEDMMKLVGEKFFEVYNGHPAVRNQGNDLYPSTERMWDIILTKRLAELNMPVMYGIATDDAHNYHNYSSNNSNPGRGWVMVRSRYLTPESIIHAMEDGEFYASSGVMVENIEVTDNELSLILKQHPEIDYTTQFIGTRSGYDTSSKPRKDPNSPHQPITNQYSKDIGEVLAKVEGNNPSYTFQGDEIYVRATVRSSVKKENPYMEGEYERAWIQPVVLNQ